MTLSDKETEKEANAENRMRYQFLAQQIDTIKGLQWSITYYALLVFAGIVGIVTLIYKNLKYDPKVYLFLSIGLFILATFILVFIIYMIDVSKIKSGFALYLLHLGIF